MPTLTKTQKRQRARLDAQVREHERRLGRGSIVGRIDAATVAHRLLRARAEAVTVATQSREVEREGEALVAALEEADKARVRVLRRMKEIMQALSLAVAAYSAAKRNLEEHQAKNPDTAPRTPHVDSEQDLCLLRDADTINAVAHLRAKLAALGR